MSCSGWYNGIKLSSGSLGILVSENDCINNAIGILVEVVENATISGNTISQNQELGLSLEATTSAAITNNTITRNAAGIFIDNASAELAIHGNDIYDNELYGLKLVGTGTSQLNVSGNWWGHRFGPYHQEKNPAGRGDEVVGDVDFSGWSEEKNNEDEDVDDGKGKNKEDTVRVRGSHVLTLLIIITLVLLVVVVKMPDEYFGGRRASTQPAETENTGTISQASQGVNSCPHCGGRFEVSTLKRPISFRCHFCGREIEFE